MVMRPTVIRRRPLLRAAAIGGTYAAGSDVLSQLSQLTAMHDNGALSDEEFAAAKAKVLGQ
jgi:hypothetical protein